jgi:RNA polymerase sigma-70 factor (ECF subfamily)
MGVNELSLEEAYRRWADELVGYASVLVPISAAADVVADTFADLLARPSVGWSEARDAKGFLFGAISNRARMHHRASGRRRRREQQPSLTVAGVSAVSSSAVSDPAVVDAVGDLSVQQRAVVYLTYWADYPVERVAEILGVSDGTVRRQLARARARLREVLA